MCPDCGQRWTVLEDVFETTFPRLPWESNPRVTVQKRLYWSSPKGRINFTETITRDVVKLYFLFGGMFLALMTVIALVATAWFFLQ